MIGVVLFQIAAELGSAGEDFPWLGTEISVLRVVLSDLKSTLDRAQASGFSLHSLASMGTILDYCKALLERTQNVVNKLTVADRLFSKKKVDALRTRLKSASLLSL